MNPADTPLPRAHCEHALIVSNEIECAEAIQRAMRLYAENICVASDKEELESILKQACVFQLVIIDTATSESVYGLMNTIKSTWPESEVILLSNDMDWWTESIQRGAYEMLPKPINDADLLWTAAGAILRHMPGRTMHAASH